MDRFVFRRLITITAMLLPVFCLAGSADRLIGKKVVIPDCLSDTTEYIFIHVVRNQQCTGCKVGSLYHWNDVITMIGRKDISFFYIIETRPEDSPETIQEALHRRPFSQPMFVDYGHEFLEENPWLEKRANRDINDFLLDKSNRIVKIGDPLNDLHFLISLKKM